MAANPAESTAFVIGPVGWIPREVADSYTGLSEARARILRLDTRVPSSRKAILGCVSVVGGKLPARANQRPTTSRIAWSTAVSRSMCRY